MVLASAIGAQRLAARSPCCKPMPMHSAVKGQSLPQSGTWDAFLGQHSMSDGIATSDDIAVSDGIAMPECALSIPAGICIAVAPIDSSTGASTSPAITMSATKRRMVVTRFTGQLYHASPRREAHLCVRGSPSNGADNLDSRFRPATTESAGPGMAAPASRLVQLELRLEIADALGDQAVGGGAVRRLQEDLLRRGDGGVSGGGAHVGHRLGLGLGDLGLGHLGAP
jgi:hypothetical protein